MRRMLVFLLAVALMLSLWGCNRFDKPTLGFIHSGTQNGFTSEIEKSFCAAAQQLGYSSLVLTPQEDTVEAQIALIEELIDRGVKGIVMNPSAYTGLEYAIHKAKLEDIPVITVQQDTEGSRLFINRSSEREVGAALMEAVADLTGGEGAYAILAGTRLPSGTDPWAAVMEQLTKDSSYEKLILADTVQLEEQIDPAAVKDAVSGLLDAYPDLEVICCTGSEATVACCQAVESLGVSVKVTGVAVPSEIRDHVGQGKACPYFFMWDPREDGKCAANALDALVNGAELKLDGTLTTKSGSYTLFEGFEAEYMIFVGPPSCFDGSDSYIFTVY